MFICDNYFDGQNVSIINVLITELVFCIIKNLMGKIILGFSRRSQCDANCPLAYKVTSYLLHHSIMLLHHVILLKAVLILGQGIMRFYGNSIISTQIGVFYLKGCCADQYLCV